MVHVHLWVHASVTLVTSASVVQSNRAHTIVAYMVVAMLSIVHANVIVTGLVTAARTSTAPTAARRVACAMKLLVFATAQNFGRVVIVQYPCVQRIVVGTENVLPLHRILVTI